MKVRLSTGFAFLVCIVLLLPPVPDGAQPGGLANAAPPAATTDVENVEFVGHVGGASIAVFIRSSYAYVGKGPKVAVLDVSNPSSPTVVGRMAPLPDVVSDIYVSGFYAYVADRNGGLRVVDISDPASPTEVGSHDTPGNAEGVYVSDSYAYIAAGGLRVVDISDPANPTEVGFYSTLGHDEDVYVSGSYAYVAAGTGGLRVVDIADPANPAEVGSYDMSDARGIYISGSYAYAADWAEGLRVIDVSDPANPTEVGSYDTPGNALGIYVSGSYAYIADAHGGLRVVNISDPANPTEAGFYDTPGSAWDVYVCDSHAYVADWNKGLRVMDVSDPANPTETGFYEMLGYERGVSVSGSYAYVVNGSGGLRVVDVSDIANPTEIGYCNTPGDAEGVYISASYAYVADRWGGLRVIDISNPVNPIEVGSYDTPGEAYGVYVSGSHAYVADWDRGLQVVDVSDPANPTAVGSYDTPGYAWDVYVSDFYAYVADASSGLQVVNISDPANPTEAGSYDTPGAVDIYISGSYAYVANSAEGLRVVDISDPANPTEAGSYNTPGRAYGIYVSSSYAYVVTRSGGLRIVDISDPASPTEVGFYEEAGYAWDVYVSGPYAYVADWWGGLFILRYTGAGIVPEAHADIGMPYSVYRGCPSSYAGCGGPYHGFYYGICTDLAMDAYNASASLNLQDALYQDHLAHPGRYRYGTARYPEDMRRYFHHNQQWLPNSQASQPGDIAFFDWDADGLSDHVGIVSEVDADGRPLRMVHAPGVCQVNPGGQAFEQDWNSHYDQHIQGHGRLSETASVMASADETLQLLRITIDSPSVALSLLDANGKSTSDTYDENLVASGVEASIPYIPGGSYADLGTTKVITVTQPLSNTSQYFVELTGEAAITYHLHIETLQGASVTDSEVFTQAIAAGETHGGAITLSAPGGTIEFSATSPTPAPLPGIPESLELVGLVGTSAQATFTITETGGQQALQSVALSTTVLMDSLGGTVSGSLPVISPDDFTVPAGGSQQVNAQVDLVNVAPGVYRGALVIRSDNAGTQMIPLTLEAQFHQVYLPTILKSY